MAVPAWYIRRLETVHPLGLEDHVLESLIQGVANMNMPVGIGGTVMEDIFRLPCTGLHHPAIEIILLPVGDDFRLTLGKVGLHGEIGDREIEGVLIIHGVRLRRGYSPKLVLVQLQKVVYYRETLEKSM